MVWDSESKPSIVGMGDYGVRCVSRLAEQWHISGDASVDFVGFKGGDVRLPDKNFVILAGSITGGTGSGLAPMLAEHTRQHYMPGNSSFVVAVVAVPFASEIRHVDVQCELDSIKRYADMVCVVSCDEWAVRLETSKAEVAAHCEREVGLCIDAFIHGVVKVGHIGLDLNDVHYMFGGKGNVAFGRCRMPAAGDAIDEPVESALREAGMDRAIVGAESVLVCFTAHPDSAKGSFIKAVMEVLGRHISPDASIAFGFQYDQAMVQETFQFDIWTCGSVL